MTATDQEEYWELWDTDTGNLMGDYPSLVEALSAMVLIGDPALVIGSSLGSSLSTLSMDQLRAILDEGTSRWK